LAQGARAADRHRVGLYEVLQRAAPTRILKHRHRHRPQPDPAPPTAARPLREQLGERDLVVTLVEVLPQYGQFQRDISKHVDDLLAVGVTDMRPSVMPQRFDEAVDVIERYVSTRTPTTKPIFKPSRRNDPSSSNGPSA
jgi:hypothetical protein